MGNATVWNCGFAKSVPKVLRKRFPQFSYGASQSSRILVSPIATPINTCCAAQGSKLAMPLPHTQTEEAEGSWRSCPSGPGHESLRSWIKQQQLGVGGAVSVQCAQGTISQSENMVREGRVPGAFV